MPEQNKVFVDGPDVVLNASPVAGEDVAKPGNEVLDQSFPHIMFDPKSPKRQAALSGFVGGLGSMIADTPFGVGFRRSLVDSTLDTAGTLSFELGSNMDESAVASDFLSSPKGVLQIAAQGPASLFLAGDRARAEAVKRTRVPFEFQRLGVDLQKKSREIIESQNLDPEYKETADKFLHDLGAGASSITLALGSSLLLGEGFGATYFGMIQKAQTFKEMTRTANVIDVKSGKEFQLDLMDTPDQYAQPPIDHMNRKFKFKEKNAPSDLYINFAEMFERDPSGMIREGMVSKDGRFKISRAPLDMRTAGAYSTLAGINEAALEWVGLNLIIGRMRNLVGLRHVNKALGKAAIKTTRALETAARKNPLLWTFLVAGEQAFQEAAQQGAEEALAKIGWSRPGTKSDIAKRIGYSALLGFLIGVPTGSLSTFALNIGIRADLIKNGMTEGQADRFLEKYSERVIELGREDALIMVNDILADNTKLYQSKEGQPAFFSALEQRLEQRMPESARPDQVLGILREGVKAEEIEASGVMNFLIDKDRVSKKELLEFIRTNRIEIKEITKRDLDSDGLEEDYLDYISELKRKYGVLNSTDLPEVITKSENEKLEKFQKSIEESKGDAKFQSYQLPGGENYREVLLTLPEKFQETIYDIAERLFGKTYYELSQKQKDKVVLTSNENEAPNNFKSSHFDEPNVLAHFRLNDRQTEKGKTLFIEEIQSDWHQQGRKKGYAVTEDEFHKRAAEELRLRKQLTKASALDSEVSKEELRKIQDAYSVAAAKFTEVQKKDAVPDAPFKKTWHELALKRILRMAVEEGYDSIAWTTGEQQNERYDLSKKISSVRWSPDTEELVALGHNEEEVIKQTVKREKIDDYIGKDLSNKLLRSEDRYDDGSYFLAGEDLRIGGEGMKGFYDQILPTFLNKYTKKWGGRVSSSDIEDPDGSDEVFWVRKNDGELLYPNFLNKEKAEAKAKEIGGTVDYGKNPTVKVHSLEITDEMRAGVMQGQPLFQSGSKSEATTKKEALAQWKKLKDLIPAKYWAIMADLIDTDFNAFADLSKKLIVLTKDLKKTTVPHEAFHVIYNELLNENERQALQDEVFLKEGFSDSLEQEEWLAERFAEEWLAREERSKTVGGRIEQFLKDMVTFLRNFIASLDTVETAFRDISEGAFNRRMKEAQESSKVRFQEKEEKKKKNETPEFIIDVDFTDQINEIGEMLGKLGGDDKRYIEARYELDHLERQMEAIQDFRDRVGKIRKHSKQYLKEEMARIPKRYVTKDSAARSIDEVMDDLSYENMSQLIDDMVKNEAKASFIKNRMPDLYDTVDAYEKLEKAIQKQVKKAVEKKLPPVARGGITPPELNFGTWSDKRAFSLVRETFERNIEDIVDKEQIPTVKQFIVEPLKTNETKRAEFVSDMRLTVKENLEKFRIKKGSKEDRAIMAYGEGRMTESELKAFTPNWESVQKASAMFRNLYDHLIDQINDVRDAFGYEPIMKRKDYFRHYLDLGNILKEFGMIFKMEDLPTSIAGVTYTFRPGKPFTTTELSREGGHFKESAIGGFDNYLDAISKQMFHTDSVQRVRVLDKYIRNFYSSGDKRLSTFVKYLDEYGNLLAGKQSQLDRGNETYIDRWVLKFWDFMRARTSAAMIAGNVSSALTNTIPFTMFFATTDKESAMKGLFESTLTPFKRGQSFMVDGQKSDFFARRYPMDKIQYVGWESAEQGLNTIFNWMDMFAGKTVIAGKFYEGVKMGMDKAAAMKRADDYASRLLADRSWGQIPIIFRSRGWVGMLGQFQVETNNVLSNIFKDLPREYKDEAGKLFFALVQFVIYGYLYNNIFQTVTGRRPTIDPIHALLILFGWAREGEDRPFLSRAMRAAGSVLDDVPFVNFLIRGGRLPVTDVFPDLRGMAEGRKPVFSELGRSISGLFPGGGQIRKSFEGASDFAEGASYTAGGTFRYAIEQNPANFIRGLIFGKYSFPEAREYFETYGASAGAARR